MVDTDFEAERHRNIESLKNKQSTAHEFSKDIYPCKYSYQFDWLGLPIIQYPQDMIALQEIIWKTKPTVIIETGVARGGSIVFYASLLHLLGHNGKVIGIDIDILKKNRTAIENHPLSKYINLIEGSSVNDEVLNTVQSMITSSDTVMVILDSNHTHNHVLEELNRYSPLVTPDCYLVVLDTLIEDLPDSFFNDRPWGLGNNPKTAVHVFLKTTDRFVIDEQIPQKLLLTAAPDGYLRCIK